MGKEALLLFNVITEKKERRTSVKGKTEAEEKMG